MTASLPAATPAPSTAPSPALCTTPHLEAPDDFYEALIETFQGLSPEQGHALNARLVLLLANHVGEQRVLLEALAAARAQD